MGLRSPKSSCEQQNVYMSEVCYDMTPHPFSQDLSLSTALWYCMHGRTGTAMPESYNMFMLSRQRVCLASKQN